MTDQALDDLIRCDFATPLGRCVFAAGHYPASAHRYSATDQPTDHRAEADHWLAEFRERIGANKPEPRDMLLLAHIHALLALSDPDPVYDGEDDPFNRTMPR
jgi:hypothetical protein